MYFVYSYYIFYCTILTEAEGLKNTACVVDPTGLTALNVGGGKPHRTFFSKNNSASLCASHCKDWQYVFSGTKVFSI